MSVERFLVDGTTPTTATTFSELMDFIPRGGNLLEKAAGEDKVTLKNESVISINNLGYKSFTANGDTEAGADDLDTGSAFEVGTDYYVYLCDDGGTGVVVLSKNSTYPAGYSAQSSRKIGGFHYGHVRRANTLFIPTNGSDVAFGSGWETAVTVGILPNSVWDLRHRPKCAPEGMVQISDDLWVDIYPASVNEAVSFEGATNGLHIASGSLQSVYGAVPATGTEGLNWYSFVDLGARAGKRLLSYEEWTRAAFGNPQGEDGADNYGWTKTTNTGRARVGCQVDPADGSYDGVSGIKPYAVSAYNICDAVGNVQEWTGSLISRWDTGTEFAWRDVLGTGKGQMYGYNDNQLIAILAGGYWRHGVNAGARTALLNLRPWNVDTSRGARLACDSL